MAKNIRTQAHGKKENMINQREIEDYRECLTDPLNKIYAI